MSRAGTNPTLQRVDSGRLRSGRPALGEFALGIATFGRFGRRLRRAFDELAFRVAARRGCDRWRRTCDQSDCGQSENEFTHVATPLSGTLQLDTFRPTEQGYVTCHPLRPRGVACRIALDATVDSEPSATASGLKLAIMGFLVSWMPYVSAWFIQTPEYPRPFLDCWRDGQSSGVRARCSS